MYGHQYFRKYIVLKTKSHRKEKAVGQNTDKITQWRNNKCAWWGAVRLFGPMARTSFTTDDRRWNSHSGKELEKHLCALKNRVASSFRASEAVYHDWFALSQAQTQQEGAWVVGPQHVLDQRGIGRNKALFLICQLIVPLQMYSQYYNTHHTWAFNF